MARIELPKLRYAAVFRWLVIFDMLSIVTLWIIGGVLQLQEREIDQIIKFHFTDSVFDVILLSSFKALVLFILINELENSSLWIIYKTRLVNDDAATEILVDNDQAAASTNTFDNDQGALIRQVNDRSVDYYKSVKKFMHALIMLVSLGSLTYLGVKFGFILSIILQDNGKSLPMDYLFFSTLAAELGLTLVQSFLGFLSWTFMRRLSKLTDAQLQANAQNSEEETKKKVNFKRLLSLSYPERYLISIAIIMLVIASFTTIAVPYFFGLVVDAAMNKPTLKEMNMYVVYMFLTFFGGSIAGGFRSWLFELAGQRVVTRLRQNVFGSIIKQDIQFFDTNRTGELTSRISSDSQVLQNAVTSNISMMLRYIIQILGCVIFMFSLEPSLTGLLLGVIPVVSLLTVYYGRYLRKLRKEFQDQLAASNIIAEEAISSARTVRSFAAESKVYREYEKNIQNSFLFGKKLAAAQGGFMAFVGLLAAGAMSLVLWYGGKLVHDKKLTTGILASFLMYTLQVAMAFAFLSSLYGDMMQALGASQRIFELLDSDAKIPLNCGAKPKSQAESDDLFDGSVELSSVSFSYPTRPETKVLDDVSLKIDRGKTIALVGPSGGGKSTVFSLLERFYDPDTGSIKLGPSMISIKDLNANWLHSQVALVSQEPVLFGGSIKENISFGIQGDIELDRIIEAARLANAHDFIMSFEKGYETLVGERGIRLSGGQKQRIAIARALLVNPKLLLLDEATSALDSESEHLVQEAIDNAMKDRTVCIIAHRLSTVRNADKVIVLEKGTIVESGTHEQLCEIDGIYKRLVLRQLLSKE